MSQSNNTETNNPHLVSDEAIAIREAILRDIANSFVKHQLPVTEAITIILNTLYNCYLMETKGDKVEAAKMMLTEAPVLMVRMCASIVAHGGTFPMINMNNNDKLH